MEYKIINFSSLRLFSVFQFSIIIILFHQITHVHPTLTSLLENSRGRAVHIAGMDEESFKYEVDSHNEYLKKPISNIALYEFGIDFSDGPETTLGSTDTTVDESDLPETTPETPITEPQGTPPTTVVPVNPGEDEEDIYWYERPEGYITLGVIGFVSLVGIGSAVFFICKKKMAIQAIQKAKLLPNLSYA